VRVISKWVYFAESRRRSTVAGRVRPSLRTNSHVPKTDLVKASTVLTDVQLQQAPRRCWLDLDTSGLLLLTNDTQFAERVANPSPPATGRS
jgi:hypothetical protein